MGEGGKVRGQVRGGWRMAVVEWLTGQVFGEQLETQTALGTGLPSRRVAFGWPCPHPKGMHPPWLHLGLLVLRVRSV